MKKKLLIDLNECARLLGKSPAAIRNMVYRRQIPFRKIGADKRARVYFEPSELEAWIESLEGLTAEQIMKEQT